MSTHVKRYDPKCAICDRLVHKIPGTRKIIASLDEAAFFSRNSSQSVSIDDIICGYCRVVAYKRCRTDDSNNRDELEELSQSLSQSSVTDVHASQSSQTDPTFYTELPTDSEECTIEYIEIEIPRTVSTHKYCCLCTGRNKLRIVPQEARMQSYIKRRVYIPEGNRCCEHHLIKNRLYDDDLNLLKVFSNSSLIKAEELKNIFDCLSNECNLTLFDKIGNFNLSEEQIRVFTGLTWDNILELRRMMISMRDTAGRTVTQALIVFLLKLRSGNSNKMIASILQLEKEQLVSEYSSSVINAFETYIFPTKFGLMTASRNDLIENNTTEIVKKLYGIHDKLILICDGTYAYHQKSSNNEYQRKSYSGQKKTSLCKPFTICTTNGFVVDMLGPYLANVNDAEIMRRVIEDPNGLCNLLLPGDIFVVDRGFRDVKCHLESKGFRVLMPALKGTRHQLTTCESNESRFVTKIRWVVEAVHGMIKQKYRLLDQKFDNKMLPKIGVLYRIASFLLNQFGKRLNSDDQISSEVVEHMIAQKDIENTLAIMVEENGWFRKRMPFQNISSSDLFNFPELTEIDLKILFTGTYQYSQAISYLGEILNKDGSLNLQFLKDQSNILKLQVQSRHISRKVYRCFIEYTPDSIGYSGIKRYFCECANGRRTVGCCSHIAAIIYYLSYGRYLSKIPRPAQHLCTLFKTNGITPVINADSDED